MRLAHIPLHRFENHPAPQRVVAVIDPRAGRGSGHYAMRVLRQKHWGVDVQIFQPDPADPDTYRRAIETAQRSGAQRILVSGGDGTLARTITAMLTMGDPLPVAVIPTGTANVVAGDLHLPRRVYPAIELALSAAHVHWWDAGQLQPSGDYFTLRVSAGHDANTLALVNKRAKSTYGTLAYIIPGAVEILRMEPVSFTLTIDDQAPLRLSGITAFVAATSRMSGQMGFYLSNQTRTDDGVLYAGVLHPQRVFANLPRVLQHMALEAANFDEIVTLFPVKHHVRIDSDTPQRTQIDGDLLGHTPLVANVRPRAVPFITPPYHMQRTARFTSRVSHTQSFPPN